jgi:hypothetical protein
VTPRARALEYAVRAVAAALALGLVGTAWHDVSKAWDAWAYHLPFAARIAGIVGPETYTFGAENEARFAGFPLVAEALQGLFWRLTSRPECANFVALFSLFALPLFLWRAFRVSPHIALIALLAIPLVQIHATQCYVDLPANVGGAVLVLLAFRAWSSPEAPSATTLAGAAVVAIATANAKFQLVPVVLAASLALLLRARVWRDKRRLALFVFAAPLVFATPIKNVVRHGNPVWPVEARFVGKTLPHATTQYESSPTWLADAPRPARFAASALEIGVKSWSVDQWTPPDDPGYRMGGFFGAYVVAALGGIVVAAWKKRTREAKVAAAFVVGVTLVVSVLPQSHELRYYMCWMLVLVALNLVLWARERPGVVSAIALSALAFVAWSTRGVYLYPSGESFASLVASRVDQKVIDAAQPGTRICIAAEPWTFLYAPAFHGARRERYTVLEATRPEECPAQGR